MRILISADIEGISGVMSPEQTSPGSGEYERARLLMTREVNAAVEVHWKAELPRYGWLTGMGNTTISCWKSCIRVRAWSLESRACLV